MNKCRFAQNKAASRAVAGVLQRRCACGNHTPAGGECRECGQQKPWGLQTKLKVNQPGDVYEQEADRIADQVTATPAHRSMSGALSRIRRYSGQSTGQMDAAPASVDRALAGPGRPLEPTLRQDMEECFGCDFSRVRVHTGEVAEQSVRDVNANAYTLGYDIMFGSSQFTPGVNEGRWLLAHELAHVTQQRRLGARLQCQTAACPRRPRGEVERSNAPGGILTTDVVFTASAMQLDIMDFAVSSATLPPGATDSADWQQAMSLMAGDPSIRIAVTGFTDCTGSDAENLSLRRRRAQAVIAAMPAPVRGKVLFSFTITTSDFLDTNTTPEGRARNRAVRIKFASAPPRGQDPCDMLPKARNLDEYLFLVRCLETRLGLTAANDTPKALSVLRQIYYGSAQWSVSQNAAWNAVIPNRPWAPGTDPTGALHPPLMTALQASQVVEGTDIGHILTGIDAMLHPQLVVTPGPLGSGLQTDLANEEWATWAGDVGSAAAEWAFDAFMSTPSTANLNVFFRRFASDADLTGDVDSFAMRAGGGGAATPPAQLMQTIQLTGPLSNALLQYFRITGSALGVARGRSVRNFVEAYGGVIVGRTLSNRQAFAAQLRPSVDKFARLYALRLLLKPGPNPQRPPGAPDFGTLITTAIDEMTERFIDWLAPRL